MVTSEMRDECERLDEQWPAFADALREIHHFIQKAMDGNAAAANALFRSISKESCRTNCSEFRGAGCRRSKRALPTSRKETVLGSLILRRANTSRLSGQWSDDDYDVLEDGVVVGRIFKVTVAPAELPWICASGHNGDIRVRVATKPTREAAMPTFANTWRCSRDR